MEIWPQIGDKPLSEPMVAQFADKYMQLKSVIFYVK